MKTVLLLALLAFPMLLNGCFTPVIEGATEIHDWYRRDTFDADAASGDPVAQFKLGNTYCCHAGGPLDAVSIHNNNRATYWYCQAAQQGYGPAQLRLAQLYSGHPIKGFRIAQHASAALGNTQTDLSIALMWASIVADQGNQDGVELRDIIAAHATPEQRASAATLTKNWRAAPCRWKEVFPSAKSGASRHVPSRKIPVASNSSRIASARQLFSIKSSDKPLNPQPGFH